MTPSDLSLIKQTLTFWQHLTPDEQQYLTDNIEEVSYTAGENIHSGNNDCIGLLIVKTGQLRTYLLSEEGKEFTFFRLEEGGACALSASCLFSSITFDVFIDAEVDTQLLIFNSSALAKLQEKNIYVENYALKVVSESFSMVINAVERMLFHSFERRMAEFLTEEMERLGSDDIKLTHEQIAKYMGTAREVVSRTLKQFEKNGLVRIYRGGVQITDRQQLGAYIA